MLELKLEGFKYTNEEEADFGCHHTATYLDVLILDCTITSIPSSLADPALAAWKRRVKRLYTEAKRNQRTTYAEMSVYVDGTPLPLNILEDMLFTLEYTGYDYTIIIDQDIAHVREYLKQFESRDYTSYDGPARRFGGSAIVYRPTSSVLLNRYGWEAKPFYDNTLGDSTTHFGLRPSHYYKFAYTWQYGDEILVIDEALLGKKTELTLSIETPNKALINDNHTIILDATHGLSNISLHNSVNYSITSKGLTFDIPERFGVDSWIDSSVSSATLRNNNGAYVCCWFKAEELSTLETGAVSQRVITIGGNPSNRSNVQYGISTQVGVGFEGTEFAAYLKAGAASSLAAGNLSAGLHKFSLEALEQLNVKNINATEGLANWTNKWHHLLVNIEWIKNPEVQDGQPVTVDRLKSSVYLNGTLLVDRIHTESNGSVLANNPILFGRDYDLPENGLTQAGFFDGYIAEIMVGRFAFEPAKFGLLWESLDDANDPTQYAFLNPKIDNAVLSTEPKFYVPLTDVGTDVWGYKRDSETYQHQVLGEYLNKNNDYPERLFYGQPHYFRYNSRAVLSGIPSNDVFFGGFPQEPDEENFPQEGGFGVGFWYRKTVIGDWVWWTYPYRHTLIQAYSRTAANVLQRFFDASAVRGESIFRFVVGEDNANHDSGSFSYLTGDRSARNLLNQPWTHFFINVRPTIVSGRQGHAYEFYKNGVRVANASRSRGFLRTPSADPIYIGGGTNLSFVDGEVNDQSAHAALSHFTFYDRFVSPQDVSAIASAAPITDVYSPGVTKVFAGGHFDVYENISDWDTKDGIRQDTHQIAYNQPASLPTSFDGNSCFRTKAAPKELLTYEFAEPADLSEYTAVDLLTWFEVPKESAYFSFKFYDAADNLLLDFETSNYGTPMYKGRTDYFVDPICRPRFFGYTQRVNPAQEYTLPANCKRFTISLLNGYRQHHLPWEFGLSLQSLTFNKVGNKANSRSIFHPKSDESPYFDSIKIKKYEDDGVVLNDFPVEWDNNLTAINSYTKEGISTGTLPGTTNGYVFFGGAGTTSSNNVKRYLARSSELNDSFSISLITRAHTNRVGVNSGTALPAATMFMASENGSDYDFAFGFANNRFIVRYIDNTETIRIIESGDIASFLEAFYWYQVTVCFDKDTSALTAYLTKCPPLSSIQSMYIDIEGPIKVIDQVLTSPFKEFNTSRTAIGRHSTNSRTDVDIADLFFFDRPLTSVEVEKLKPPRPFIFQCYEDKMKQVLWQTFYKDTISWNGSSIDSVGRSLTFKPNEIFKDAPIYQSYYRFNEPLGISELRDDGYSYPATYINRKNEYFWRDAAGLCMLAELDGSTPRYVETDFLSNRFNGKDFTIGCFFKKPVIESEDNIKNRLFTAFTPAGTGFAFGLDGNRVKVWVGNNVVYTVPEDIVADTWNHICISYTHEALEQLTGITRNSVWKVYLNGEQFYAGDEPDPGLYLEPYHPDNFTFVAPLPALSNTLKCWIGNGVGNRLFNGYIDDFFVLERAIMDHNTPNTYLDPTKNAVRTYNSEWGNEVLLISR